MFRPLPAFRPTPLRRRVCGPHSHATIRARSRLRSGRWYRPGPRRRRRRPPARGTIWHLRHRRRSPATACAPVRLRATPTARPSSVRSSLSSRRAASGRRERAAASSVSKPLELQAQRIAKGPRFGFFKRRLVGGARFGALLLRGENVPALRGIESLETRLRLRLENFERGVGFVVVEKHAGQPQSGNRADLIAPRVLDGPLQLRARSLQVSRLKLDFGRNQRCERRVRAARKILQDRPRGLASRLEIAGARRLLQRVVQHRGLRGLRTLIPHPAVPGRDGCKHHSRAEENRAAVLLPPGFQGGQLFLFFEIVRAHSFSPVPKSRSDIASARRSCGTRNCARSSRKALTLASPACSSSSPTITATGAPLASAFFICDLKLPPPQCCVTLKPAPRRASAMPNAARAALSPWFTRYTSGEARSPESASSASRRSIPIAQPQAGAGFPPICSDRLS